MKAFYKVISVSLFLILNSSESAFSSLSTKQGMFSIRTKTYMNVEPITDILVTEKQSCALYCLRTDKCLSYNMEIGEKHTKYFHCELLSKSLYDAPKKLVPQENFDHFNFLSPCTRDRQPCLNGGTCVIQYHQADSYRCTCPTFYHGINCELDIRNFDVHFPSPGSVLNYVQLDKNPSQVLAELTVCLWVKTDNMSPAYGTMVSYATHSNDDELIIYDYTNVRIYINGDYKLPGITLNNNKWNHLCVTWTNTNGSLAVFKNGAKVQSYINFMTNHSLPARGTFILGQDQDVIGGGFEDKEAMVGHLSQVNLWDKVIPEETIQEMSSSCECKMEGNVVSWSELKTGVRGDAKILAPSKCIQVT